jgi:hypothetical protein
VLQRTFRGLGATLIVFLLLLAAAWPWPAPEVDWRTPLLTAVKSGDCRTARNIAAALPVTKRQSALQRVLAPIDDGCRSLGYLDLVAGSPAPTGRPPTTAASFYSLEDNDLGLLRHQYVWLSAFFCAMPYNHEQSVDNVALSGIIPGNDGLVMSAHRARRDICIGHWESTIEGLVNATDRAAQEVAWTALNRAPLDSKHAAVLYARLVLEQGFVPRPADHIPSVTETIRKLAWDRLRDAATEGHAPAVRLQSTLLLQGRYRPHDDRDDKEDYYRRLRGEKLPSRLSEPDRTQIAGRKEAD